MQREEHILDELHIYRYRGENPRYALVISHGIASHAGIYDVFCNHHALKGVDIWSYSAPGHGQSTPNRPRGQFTLEEWVEAGVSIGKHIQEQTGLPVFTLGSSLGVAAAYSALHSDVFIGGILMGAPVVPAGPVTSMMATPYQSPGVQGMLEALGRSARLDIGLLFNFDEDYGYAGAHAQKKLDPWNTWSYDLASWASIFTYQPKNPIAENRKPILVASGEHDPTFPPAMMKSTADAIAGPVEYYMVEGGSHQLMLFHTEEFSNKVEGWIANYL